MKVVILGGARDGEEIIAPDGAISYRFAKMPDGKKEYPSKFSVKELSSVFGPPVTYEEWNIKKKVNVWTREEYLVLLEPRLEKWIRESFGIEGI